ncbi:unnamed protein product [Thelazia callipaeda]|uniref:t-SNARE coiled-coil homology domain-containing protein n=1 Tax=Thelazia callipaeda TaxID=103827 RepID=A0A0N5D9D8_THECL|nr:unnamed protein product [Thelazia callipaeda]
MKDRLSDLQQGAKIELSLSSLIKRLDEDWSNDSDNVYLLNKPSSSKVDMFLTQVDVLMKEMSGMQKLLNEIKDWHWKIIAEPGDHPSMNVELDKSVKIYTTRLYKIQAALKSLSAEIEYQFGESNMQTTEARIKRNQMMTLTRKFQCLLVAFNDEQLSYKDKCKRKISSYLKISENAMNDEDLESVIEKGTLFEYTKQLVLAERAKKALYDEVRTRHEDIIKLESSVKELHNLFLGLATLIENQGEMLDDIERNVDSAVDYAQKAHSNIIKAKVMQASARKKAY